MSKSLLFCLLCFVIYGVHAQTPDLVIELFRHGARAPINGSYGQAELWGVENIGELTGVGMREHFILGGALRNEFPSLLDSYNSTEIYVRSTDVNRTIMSAYSHLYGIFNTTGPNLAPTYPQMLATPPFLGQQIQDFVDVFINNSETEAVLNNFQPVPIHVVQASDDQLLIAPFACPGFIPQIANNKDDREASLKFNHFNGTVQYLKDNGINIYSMADLYTFGDTVICNNFHNYPLPGGINASSQYYLDGVIGFQYINLLYFQNTFEQNAYSAYLMWYTALGYMNAVYNGSSSLNWVIWSAHDSTLNSLLASMGHLNAECLWINYLNISNNQPLEHPNCIYPNFAANIQWEFFINGTDPYVQMRYNGTMMTICHGLQQCPLELFTTYVGNVTGNKTMDEFNRFCTPPVVVKTETYLTLLIVLSALSGLTLVLLIYLITTMPKKATPLESVKVQAHPLIDNSN